MKIITPTSNGNGGESKFKVKTPSSSSNSKFQIYTPDSPMPTPPPAPAEAPGIVGQTIKGMPKAAVDLYKPLVKDVLGVPKKGFNWLTDKLSDTKFFREAAEGYNIDEKKKNDAKKKQALAFQNEDMEAFIGATKELEGVDSDLGMKILDAGDRLAGISAYKTGGKFIKSSPEISKNIYDTISTKEGRSAVSRTFKGVGLPSVKNLIYNYNQIFYSKIGADKTAEKQGELAAAANQEVIEFIEANPDLYDMSDDRGFIEKLASEEGEIEIAKIIGSQLPILGTIAGIAVVSKGAGIPSMVGALGPSFIFNTGDSYQQAKDFYKETGYELTPKEERAIQNIAILVGMTIAPLDAFSTSKILTAPNKTIVQNTFRTHLTHALIRAGTGTLTEAGTEGTQELIQNAWALTYNEHQDLFEGVPEAAFGGGLFGMGMSITGSTVAPLKGITTSIAQKVTTPRPPEIEPAPIKPEPAPVETPPVVKPPATAPPVTPPTEPIITPPPVEKPPVTPPVEEPPLKKITHFTKDENVNKILTEGFDTSLPPVHGTGGKQGGVRTEKFGEDILYFTTDLERWKTASVYTGGGTVEPYKLGMKPGPNDEVRYNYDTQKYEIERNAIDRVDLSPIEAEIKKEASILKIDSLKSAETYLGKRIDPHTLVQDLIEKAKRTGTDILNIKNKGNWSDGGDPTKTGYDVLTGGSGKSDYFVLNKDAIVVGRKVKENVEKARANSRKIKEERRLKNIEDLKKARETKKEKQTQREVTKSESPKPVVKPKAKPTAKPADLRIKPGPKRKDIVKIKGKKVLPPPQHVSKTGLKGMIKAHGGELTFTVDKDLKLIYKDDKTSILLKPSALGLVEDNLKAGMKVIITSEDLKETGAGFKAVGPDGKTFASIGEYANGDPVSTPKASEIKAIEIPELVMLAKELMGQVPKIRTKVSKSLGKEVLGSFLGKGDGTVTILADLFDPELFDPTQLAKTLAHEIGHLTDYLPNKTMARGNLLGRLLVLKNFRKDFTSKAGATRSNSAVYKELWALSKEWRPLMKYEKKINANTGRIELVGTPLTEEQTPKGFLEYRKSSAEIYADFLSALFNDPALVEEKAPEAYNLFFEHLDKKPIVKDAYFNIQAMLTGDRTKLVATRRRTVWEMFGAGERKALDIQKARDAQRKVNRKEYKDNFKYNFISTNYPLIDARKKVLAEGKYINPDEDPLYMFEERNYLGGKIKAILEADFNPIYQSIMKADIPWVVFGEAIFLRRITKGDRSKQANPGGITLDAAREMYDALENDLTPEQLSTLNKALKNFNTALKKITDEAYKEGLYTPALNKKIVDNPAYGTFQVLEYLDEAHTSEIYKSLGTFDMIENVADATILKLISTVRAIERNRAVRAAIQEVFIPLKEAEKANVTMTSQGRRFVASKSKTVKKDLVVYKDKGIAQGYYVDPYVKGSLENDSIGNIKAVSVMLTPLRYINKKWFRPVFIVFSLGYQTYNFIRDFWRFWKKTNFKNKGGKDMTLARTVQRYYQAYPLARTRAFGPKLGKDGKAKNAKWQKAIDDLHMLEKEKVFSVTFNDMALGDAFADSQIERIMNERGIAGFQKEKKRWLKSPVMALLDSVRQMGDLIETLPKGAGFWEFTGGDRPLTPDEASFVRRHQGSPDFFDGGYLKPATNEIALFSNAITQGIRADIETATNPETMGGYWWKTAKQTYLPKFIMIAAQMGLFGTTLKGMMEDIPEHDKTNCMVTVPMGQTDNGKTIYVCVPNDETGRFLGGLAWKTFTGATNDVAWNADVAQIFEYTGGNLPSMTPTVTVPYTLWRYSTGANPYDAFRGRPILPDTVHEAGGMRANIAMLKWTFNAVGGGIIRRFSVTDRVPQEKTTIEKVVKIPIIGGVIGRFLKVSDYGTKEMLTQVAKNQAQLEARKRLDKWEMIYDYVEEAIKDPAYGTPEFNQREYEDRFAEQWIGSQEFDNSRDKRDEKNSVKKSFQLGMQKSESTAEVQVLLSAGSNDQKKVVLEELRTRMPEEEYQSFIREIQRAGIISLELRREVD